MLNSKEFFKIVHDLKNIAEDMKEISTRKGELLDDVEKVVKDAKTIQKDINKLAKRCDILYKDIEELKEDKK